MPDVLTLPQAAAWLQVSIRTVRRLINDGSLPAIRVRGSIRILSSALESYVKSGGSGKV